MSAKSDASYANTLGQVELCDCGGVNLKLGPMTLHFAADEALALGELLDGARRLIEREQHKGVAHKHSRGSVH